MDEHDPTTTTDESLNRKHAAMLERLSNRHNARHVTPKPTSSESTQSFLSQFSLLKSSIETRLQPDPARYKPELDSVSLSISHLENLLAHNSYFLPPYEIRTCLSTISNLKQTLDDVTSLVIPRKKFSFKNKPQKKQIPPQNDRVSVENVKTPNLGLGFGKLSSGIGFRDRENEVLVKEFDRGVDEGQNGEFTLSGLSHCEVRLKGCLRALFVDRLVDCKVYVGAVMGSVLIEGAEGCVFVLSSHQIRIHDAKSCDFYLRVRSRPIIEDSNGVRFAPYCLRYEGIERDLEEANLVEETGNWANVDDFKWLRAVQSPNWSVLPENERIEMVDFRKVE